MEQIVVDNRYALTRTLGGGGMAKVYLAHDQVLDRDVAIKILREQYADDEEFVGRFKREAQSAAALSHPHIVQIYDRGRSEDGSYYIAMEYVPGGTLKERLVRDGALAPGVAAGVAEQIADALSAAHEKGVIHRDIKPQNVLVTNSGDVKVTDFGIARAVSSTVTATSVVLGTAGYMSPEQAQGQPVGPASDLYSLGVVLYQMLTGSLPFEAESPFAQAMRHVSEPPPSPREANPEVPDALDAITMKLLAKDPKDRYPSAEALMDDLGRIQSGLAPAVVDAEKTQTLTTPLPLLPQTSQTAVRPPAAAPPTGYAGQRTRRRGRLFPAIIVLLLVVALLAGAAWALTQDFELFGGGNTPDPREPDPQPPAPREPATVAVPNVVGGFTQEEAEAELDSAGLVADPRFVESSVEDEGFVVQQDPVAGVSVEEGGTVTIYVGSGPSTVTVPDLVDASTAENDLANAGLVLGTETNESSDTIPAGQVIRTDPAGGTDVEPGTAVNVVVSTGPTQPQQQYEPTPAPSGGDAFQEPGQQQTAQPQGGGRGGNNRKVGGGEGGDG